MIGQNERQAYIHVSDSEIHVHMFERMHFISILEVNSSDTVRRAYHMNCPLNDRRLPKEDNTVSGIISEYADNQVFIFILLKKKFRKVFFIQDLWVDEFIAAFEKMMRNGYQDGELTDAPGSWENVVCKRIKNKMTCQRG